MFYHEAVGMQGRLWKCIDLCKKQIRYTVKSNLINNGRTFSQGQHNAQPVQNSSILVLLLQHRLLLHSNHWMGFLCWQYHPGGGVAASFHTPCPRQHRDTDIEMKEEPSYLGVKQAISGIETIASPVIWMISALDATCSWNVWK